MGGGGGLDTVWIGQIRATKGLNNSIMMGCWGVLLGFFGRIGFMLRKFLWLDWFGRSLWRRNSMLIEYL